MRQTGVGLVELLIAMGISMVITLVVMTAYLGGVATQRSQADMTRLQEGARFAYLLLAKELKKSGYHNPNSFPDATTGIPPQPFCVDGVDGFVGSALVPSNDSTSLTLGDGATAAVLNRSDALTVRFYGDDIVSGALESGPTPDPAMVDCLGNTVGQETLDAGLTANFAGQATLVEDTLYVAADGNNGNEPSLFCSSTTRVNGTVTRTATVALIPGVESVQLLYGEDNNGDGQVDRYVTAANLASTFNILDVWVSVVIRTASRLDAPPSRALFNHFGAAYASSDTAPNGDAGSVFTAPQDQRMRAQFAATVALRNFPTCQ